MSSLPGATTFVHLSDTHIGVRGVQSYGTDTPGNLRAVADSIRTMNVNPAFFIFSGDLSDTGEPESYAHFSEILEDAFAPFGVPLLLGMGNHDRRVHFRQVLLGQTEATEEGEPYFYSQHVGDLRVIMLDSKIPGRTHGTLGEEQIQWLESELANPAPGGDLIALHHPCLPRGVPRPDDFLLLDSPALAEALTRCPNRNVLGILCGHAHVSTVATFEGVLHVSAPATAFQQDPSFQHGGSGLEGAGFNLCTIRDGRLLVNPVILPGGGRELFHEWET